MYASVNLANICSGNGLVPGGTKPLPELMLVHCELHFKEQYSEHFLMKHQTSNTWVNMGTGNGFLRAWQQVLTGMNDNSLLIRSPGTYFNGILINCKTFSFKKMHLKMKSLQTNF